MISIGLKHLSVKVSAPIRLIINCHYRTILFLKSIWPILLTFTNELTSNDSCEIVMKTIKQRNRII